MYLVFKFIGLPLLLIVVFLLWLGISTSDVWRGK